MVISNLRQNGWESLLWPVNQGERQTVSPWQKRNGAGRQKALLRTWVPGMVCKNLLPLPLRTWLTWLPAAHGRGDLCLSWNQHNLLGQEQPSVPGLGREDEALCEPPRPPGSLDLKLLPVALRWDRLCTLQVADVGEPFPSAVERVVFPRT